MTDERPKSQTNIPPDEDCASCRFCDAPWVLKEDGSVLFLDSGECKRHSPTRDRADDECISWTWPATDLDAWCGEYERAPDFPESAPRSLRVFRLTEKGKAKYGDK